MKNISKKTVLLTLVLLTPLLIAITVYLAYQNNLFLDGVNNRINKAFKIGQPTIKKLPGTNTTQYTSKPFPKTEYRPYTLQKSDDWHIGHERKDDYDITILVKNGYEIRILQTVTVQNICYFDTPAPNKSELPLLGDLTNESHVEIQSEIGLLRRFSNRFYAEQEEQLKYEFCQKNTTSNNFEIPTSIGIITYLIPKNFDETILLEMDQIVSTLREASE